MRNIATTALAVMCVMATDAVDAQQGALGSIETTYEPTYRSGALVGCGLGYKAGFQDQVYRQGELSAALGAFGILKADQGRMAAYLKLRVLDFSTDARDRQSFKPAELEYAYLLSPKGTSIAKGRIGSFQSDPAGMLFSTFHLNAEFFQALGEMTAGLQGKVMFARKGSTFDAPVPLDLAIASRDQAGKAVRDLTPITSFADCLPKLSN